MKVLFITSSRIGDAVLSTGLLRNLKDTYPGAHITVVCGPLAASLFAGVPGLERVIALKKQKHNKHWIELWREVWPIKWDIVVDLRNSAVSRLIRAKKRCIFDRRIDQNLHKVEQNAAVMALNHVPAPQLWPTKEQSEAAYQLIPPGGAVLGVGPTANWAGKTWPAERFIALISLLTGSDGILPGARVAVFAAPGEEDSAYQVLSSVPEALQIDIIAKTDPGTAAAALQRCALYVGNDSGLMHCAAAMGVPTFGLFGPSWPHLYRPWGAHTAYAATPKNYDELIDFPGYDSKTAGSLMTSLDVETVYNAIGDFWERHEPRAA
ncbi:MAG: glycosyltransferase family 9 protein [Micavibrio aeruginosavorus]|uniref:Glycosyltransferase family 9 protein n=1 Tax=Micavibrio aeruginosavorus TaxID=349221 RepID=A0A7T5R416_9BACT|nr:MAG: glycosyltransferase family 9 protein [Micavibrio aeruginosavorus]